MKNKIMCIIIGVLFLLIALVFGFGIHARNKCMEAYYEGVSLLKSGNYMAAIDCFNDIPDYIEYKDIAELLREYEVKDVCPYCGHILK